MIAVVGRRLLALPLILFAVALLVFLLAWASPYDPAEAYVQGAAAGDALTPELREQFERAWGLEDPMPVQFLSWLGRLVQGDLGESRYLSGAPVVDALKDRAYPSLVLLGSALGVVLVGALLAGVAAAAFRDSPLDWLIRTSAYAATFVPSFWVALLAVFVFAVQLDWLPAAGASNLRSVDGGRVEFRHLLLPMLTLALTQHGWFTLYVRDTLLEVLRDDYVRFAEAQGVGRVAVLFRHALPNALIPFVTLIGTHIPELIGGSILIESVFGWPGLGNLTRQAAIAVDIPLLLAIVLVGAVLVVLGNLIADLLYRVIDPRIRESMR
ncbi:MAG: ABC transporter permease [Dehalococcoidia bacterium]|nr:ABC transporter permease [Dehalococcoidia bacterium]